MVFRIKRTWQRPLVMKLRILGFRNPSAIYRYPPQDVPEEEFETELNPETDKSQIPNKTEVACGGIPHDTGNRLPTGGRSGNPKIDKFQGYRTPPMY